MTSRVYFSAPKRVMPSEAEASQTDLRLPQVKRFTGSPRLDSLFELSGQSPQQHMCHPTLKHIYTSAHKHIKKLPFARTAVSEANPDVACLPEL